MIVKRKQDEEEAEKEDKKEEQEEAEAAEEERRRGTESMAGISWHVQAPVKKCHALRMHVPGGRRQRVDERRRCGAARPGKPRVGAGRRSRSARMVSKSWMMAWHRRVTTHAEGDAPGRPAPSSPLATPTGGEAATRERAGARTTASDPAGLSATG